MFTGSPACAGDDDWCYKCQVILPVGQIGSPWQLWACLAPLAKIFLFFRNANQAYDLPSHPERGALRNVINAGRVAVDEDGAPDESA